MLYALSLYRPKPVVVEIGSGDGTYARALGACSSIQIFTYDLLPLPGVSEMDNIHHSQQGLEELKDFNVGHYIDVFVANRVLHYLRFNSAVRSLTILRKHVAPSTFHGFIVLSGLMSPLAKGYEHASLKVQERFCRLGPAIGEKYEITEPVCLYTVVDAAALIEASGFRIITISHTHFGNVRAIFEV